MTGDRLPFVAPLPPSTCTNCGAVPLLETPEILEVLGRLARDVRDAERVGTDFISCFEILDAKAILTAARRGIRPTGGTN